MADRTFSSRRLIVGLLVTLVTFPASMQLVSFGGNTIQASVRSVWNITEDLRPAAIQNGVEVRRTRREYTSAMERCRDIMRTDKEFICPVDINKSSSFNFVYPAPHAAAEEEKQLRKPAVEVEIPEEDAVPAVTISAEKQAERDRALLRTYTRAGYCSPRLGRELYKLCVQMVGGKGAAPTGIINDNVFLHSRLRIQPASIKLRLQMLKESMDPATRRDSGTQGPLRYQGGIYE